MGEFISIILLAHLSIGAVVAVLFWSGVVEHRDPVFRRSSKRVRLVLMPGFVVLWPVVVTQRVSRKDLP